MPRDSIIENAKGKIFLGVYSFSKFKAHFDILQGEQFEINGVRFILDNRLEPNKMATGDPVLSVLFDELEAKFKDGK